MKRHATTLAFAGALAALLVGGGGCEAIVNGDIPAYTCTGTRLSACPAGQYCKGAGCTACEKVDICDGYDNDCDGKVDDGPLSDHDADGYTNCGRQDPKTGQVHDKDCDDNDPTVHPGAQEVCNGKDDDCDGTVDEPDQVCPQGEICVASKQTCISSASSCTVTGCKPLQKCDPETQQCVDPPSTADGAACTSNAQCNSQVCGDSAVLGSAFTQKSGAICTRPCCASSDCRADFVCYGAGTGGNYCVPKASVPGPARATGALGGGAGGAACAGNGDCRSGLCSGAHKCLDTCCGDGQCQNGTSCMLNNDTGLPVFQCADSPGTRGQNASCYRDSDCKGGICFDYGGGERHCVATCCGSANCGSVDFGFGITYPAACYDATSMDSTVFGSATDNICLGVQSVGGTPLGGACSQNSDCRSYRCHATAKKCTDVCCTDADCAAAGPSWSCRPTAVGNGMYLRCQPVPPAPR